MRKENFKKGAASMYVVVIAALLFGVITVSFIRLIVSESLRTTNSELAQSAYDSALAGVEDAKTALKKYYSNLSACSTPSDAPTTSTNECEHIKYYIENALNGTLTINDDGEKCSTISNALQRNGSSPSTDEVLIKQTTDGDSNTEQAYTCVTINNQLSDYKATLSSSVPTFVVPLKYANPTTTTITGIKFSWFSAEDGDIAFGSDVKEDYRFNNNYTTPPEVSIQLIQTSATFDFSSFDASDGSQTNRGTIFLDPNGGSGTSFANHTNYIASSGFVKSNSHTQSNEAYSIRCESGQDFACSVIAQLPDPIGGGRNPDTFFLVVTLPYGDPTTHFSVQMCTNDSASLQNGDCTPATFDGVQTAVDSTGRANDMFSRVEARIELSDIYFPYAEFALQLSGDGTPLNKNFYVTKNCWADSDGCNNSGEAK